MGALGKQDNICVLPQELFLSADIGLATNIWCGSEFTMIRSVDNKFWSCGWNEHGNLGNGTTDSGFAWSEVTFHNSFESDFNSGLLTTSFDGYASCGGSHCLCIL